MLGVWGCEVFRINRISSMCKTTNSAIRLAIGSGRFLCPTSTQKLVETIARSRELAVFDGCINFVCYVLLFYFESKLLLPNRKFEPGAIMNMWKINSYFSVWVMEALAAWIATGTAMWKSCSVRWVYEVFKAVLSSSIHIAAAFAQNRWRTLAMFCEVFLLKRDQTTANVLCFASSYACTQ